MDSEQVVEGVSKNFVKVSNTNNSIAKQSNHNDKQFKISFASISHFREALENCIIKLYIFFCKDILEQTVILN